MQHGKTISIFNRSKITATERKQRVNCLLYVRKTETIIDVLSLQTMSLP